MRRDPIRALARLREIEVLDARRALADAQAEAARLEAAAARMDTALRAEEPGSAPATYGVFLAAALERRQAEAAALTRAEVAGEVRRAALAGARRDERLLDLLRERRAAAERREAIRRDQDRLEDALPRGHATGTA